MATWQECVDMVDELFDKLDEGIFTDWEYQFINDMAEYEESGKLFSHNEKEKIEELYKEHC